MPRKTNDFQALIALLHRQLASPETSVSESGFITDPATGDLREVDVLIEQAVAGYQAKIAVECRDRSRAATVQWIDELIGKYQNTGIKVVAVSKRGFAKRAKIRAEKAGIEAVTATDAGARDWAAWIASMPTIVIEMERLDLAAVELILGPELSNEDLPPPRADSRLRLVAGGEWTTPLRLYDEVTQGREFAGVNVARKADDRGAPQITIRLPASAVLELSNGRLVHPHGLRFHWRVTNELVEVALKPMRVGDLDIAVGTASGSDWRAYLVWSYAADGTPRSSLSFAPGSSIGAGRTFITGSNPVPPFRPSIPDAVLAPEPKPKRPRRKQRRREDLTGAES